MNGIETVAAAIGGELLARLPLQNKKQREGLALLTATALAVRDVNLNELAAALPRAAERLDMRYQWISRVLGNGLIVVDEVMAPFGREVVARSAEGGRSVVVMIDQSKVNAAHQMLMVSLRVGERALPLAWRMRRTLLRIRAEYVSKKQPDFSVLFRMLQGIHPRCPRAAGRL
jgi:hypothetical protein